MRRSLALAMAAAVTLTVLAGCAEPAKAGTLTREVTLTLTASNIDAFASDPASLVETEYVYTHAGEPVAASEVQVVVTEEGATTTKSLAEFETGTVRAGDEVRITGISPVAEVRLESDGATMVERTGSRAEWFMVEGLPVPLAAEPGAKAVYDFSSSGELGFAVDGLSMPDPVGYCFDPPCPVTTYHVDDGSHDGKVEMSGTVALGAESSGADTVVTIAADLAGKASTQGRYPVTMKQTGSDGRTSSETTTYMWDVEGSGTLDSDVRLTFAGGRDLTRAAVTGTATYDYDVQFGEGSLGEMMSDSGSYPIDESDTIPVVAEQAQAAMLREVYDATLLPGDRFMVDVELEGIDFEFSSTVVAREDKRVGATTHDALRIHTQVGLSIRDGGERTALLAHEATHWIGAESYMPLLADTEFAKAYDETDLGPLAAVVEEMADEGFDFPESIDLTLSGATRVELTQHSDGFATSAAMSTQSALLFPSALDQLNVY